MRLKVAIQAVHADVQLPVGIPADMEVFGGEADVPDLRRGAMPLQALRGPGPEIIGIAVRCRVQAFILFLRDRLRAGKAIGNGVEIADGFHGRVL
ncbi:hypothetical protein D3C81_2008310 [compost metagenome]